MTGARSSVDIVEIIDPSVALCILLTILRERTANTEYNLEYSISADIKRLRGMA